MALPKISFSSSSNLPYCDLEIENRTSMFLMSMISPILSLKVLTCFPSVACTSFMTPSNGANNSVSLKSFSDSDKTSSCCVFSNRALSLNCSEIDPCLNSSSALSKSLVITSSLAVSSVTEFLYSKSSILRSNSPFFTTAPSLKLSPTLIT